MATYNKETFKRLFQSKFNLSKWQMLLQDYFHADKVRVSPEVLDEDAEDRKGASQSDSTLSGLWL